MVQRGRGTFTLEVLVWEKQARPGNDNGIESVLRQGGLRLGAGGPGGGGNVFGEHWKKVVWGRCCDGVGGKLPLNCVKRRVAAVIWNHSLGSFR